MHAVRVDGTEVGYDRVGQGPPLVLAHGATTDARLFRPQLGTPADEFTVVAWDGPARFGPARLRTEPALMAEADLSDLLPGITVPTLLPWGELDRRSPVDLVARAFLAAIRGHAGGAARCRGPQ
ncbi:hypothetical protein ABTZ58_06610 [Streptomyces sp. NPDC094143]|uniref:alpha/beta fold hydrolase n=1 Tax=Streptomyces sp. NPDC094143 TaxID=3155310 RepID=UPI003326386D